MSEPLHVYVDAPGAIELIGGIVKLELLSILPRSRNGDSWNAEVCHRLVLHTRALTELGRSLKSLAAQLEGAGLGPERAAPVPACTVEHLASGVAETLVEGVGNVVVDAGYIRVELTRREPDPVSLRGELRPLTCLRLAMTPGAFFAAIVAVEAALEQLGVRLLPGAAEAQRASRSPNFGSS